MKQPCSPLHCHTDFDLTLTRPMRQACCQAPTPRRLWVFRGQATRQLSATTYAQMTNGTRPVQCDVAVVGGGLGGLALAAGLQKRGFSVRVFEAAPELRTATSTIVGLGTNAFYALERLDPSIVSQIKDAGQRATVSSRHIRLSKVAEMDIKRSPPSSDIWTVRWSEVQRILAGLVPSHLVHCGYRAAGYTEEQDRVHVHFKGQPDVTARFVVAADGVRSAIRATMIPNDPGPRYLGHMNWNAMLYNPGGNTAADLHEVGELRTYWNNDFGADWTVHGHLLDAGGGYTYWSLRVQSDEPSFTPNPTQAGQHADDPSKTYIVGGGLGKPGSKARVEQILREAGFDDALLRAVQATPESDIFERAILDRIPLDELGHGMSSPGGRVVLLGDAAHAVHPGPGQGARSTFEDAHVLAAALEQHKSQLASSGWAMNATTATETDVLKLFSEVQPSHGIEYSDEDRSSISAVVAEYEKLRLARTCRIQRFAQEGCGLDHIKSAARPTDVPAEKRLERFFAFVRWVDQYPKLTTGNPDCQYWQPLEGTAKETETVILEAAAAR